MQVNTWIIDERPRHHFHAADKRLTAEHKQLNRMCTQHVMSDAWFRFNLLLFHFSVPTPAFPCINHASTCFVDSWLLYSVSTCCKLAQLDSLHSQKFRSSGKFPKPTQTSSNRACTKRIKFYKSFRRWIEGFCISGVTFCCRFESRGHGKSIREGFELSVGGKHRWWVRRSINCCRNKQ